VGLDRKRITREHLPLTRLTWVRPRGTDRRMLRQHLARLHVSTSGRQLVDVTARVARELRASGLTEGVATLFLRHTSASVLIQENLK
jgi:hypothetical protein